MQVQHMTTGHRYKDAWDAIQGIARREGLQAFYRGNGVNVLRLLPDAVLKFALHDQIKLLFTHPDMTALRLRDRLAISATTGAALPSAMSTRLGGPCKTCKTAFMHPLPYGI